MSLGSLGHYCGMITWFELPHLHKISDERDGLDRFAQSHLISKDTVQVVIVQRHLRVDRYTPNIR